jgi:ABC-type lipoprotein release transport system permease subunit
MRDLFSIPRIIPKKRITGVAIALVLSSAIFMTSSSILFEMMYVNQDFFGTAEDILVFYNEGATTPFTSSIPRVLVNSFEEVEGVRIVSPETLFPGIVKDEPIYIRGVSYPKIIDLEGITFVKGEIPSNGHYYESIIGFDLAERLDIDVDEQIRIHSVLNDEFVDMKISGIFVSDGITEDELLINLDIANQMNDIPLNSITHLRVKYDINKLTEDEIFESALKTYNTTVNVDIGNYSSNYDATKLEVKDKYGITAYENGNNMIYSFNLVQGYYTFNLFLEDELINTTSQFIQSLETINFAIDDNTYVIDLQLKNHQSPIPEMKYRIYSNNTEIEIANGYSDENGTIREILRNGGYKLTLFEQSWFSSYFFTVSKKDNIEIQIGENIIEIDTLLNNSIIASSQFKLRIPDITSLNYFLLDGVPYSKFNYDDRTELLSFDLNQGYHNFTLLRYETVISFIQFEINNSLKFFFSNTLFNFAKYDPNQQVTIKIEGISNDLSLSYVNGGEIEYSLFDSIISFNLPQTAGFYELSVTGLDPLKNLKNETWSIIVKSNIGFAGWIGPSSIPVAKLNDEIKIWTNNNTNLHVDIGQISSLEDYWIYSVPNNISGLYFHNSTYEVEISNDYGDSEFLEFLIVSDYKSLFRFENSTSSYDIDDYIGSELKLIFYENIGDLWKFEIDHGSGYFPLYPGNTIAIPNLLTNFNINITSPYSGLIETHIISVIDPLNIPDYPLLQNGFPSQVIDGKIKLLDVHYSNTNIELNRSNTPYVPINLGNNTIQISPGNYSALIFINNKNEGYKWNFTVNPWLTENTVRGNNYFMEWGFISNTNKINIISGELWIESAAYFAVKGISNPYSSYYLDRENNEFVIFLQDVADANYTISFSNGTLIHSEYMGAFTISDNYYLNSVIDFDMISMTNNSHHSQLNLQLGLDYSYREITVANRTNSHISDLELRVIFHHTKEQIYYHINYQNSTFSVYSQAQDVTFYFYLNGELIEIKEFYISEQNLLSIGNAYVSFHTFNQNYQQIENSSVIRILNIETQNIIFVDNQDYMSLEPGNYLIDYSFGPFKGQTTIYINESRDYLLNFRVLTIPLSLEFPNYIFESASIVNLTHNILNYNITGQISLGNLNLIYENLPAGWWNVSIQGEWGSWQTYFELSSDETKYLINIQNHEGDQIVIETDFGRYLDLIQIGSIQGTDYLNSYLGGALILVSIIILTQLIVIVLVLIFNLQEIAANLSFESKKEILLMKSIGASKSQIIYSYSKYLFFGSVLISFTGYFLAKVLIYYLIKSNNTIFFGHKFNPGIDSLGLILLNIFATLVMTYISILISYRQEIE